MDVEINGACLHYDVRGEGEPLLWLHGFMGVGADWKHAFDPEGFQLIAPDLRGHGASSNPSGTFTFRQAALDMLVLLQHMQVSRVKAIGLSGGGITLLHMATMDPDAISAMVVVSAPPYFPAQTRIIQRQFSEASLSQQDLEQMSRRHAGGERQIKELFAHGRGFAERYDDVNFTPPYLSRITARTLIVYGDRDPLYPVSLAFELHEAIPASHLWVVPNGGHGPIFGPAAAAFGATALPFLRGEWGAANH
jgi:pimeloyl-ACP methyl ester carboxylesterase